MTEMISILNSACVQLVGIACGAYILKCAIPEGGMQRSARKVGKNSIQNRLRSMRNGSRWTSAPKRKSRT